MTDVAKMYRRGEKDASGLPPEHLVAPPYGHAAGSAKPSVTECRLTSAPGTRYSGGLPP